MLRVTKQTDYGVTLLGHMAREPERLFSAPDLAVETDLPAPTVSKILKLLTREGILESQRGVKGGYSLRRPPESVSVAEIIRALGGPIAMTQCVDDSSGSCRRQSVCSTRGNWQRINDAISEALEGISLLEMAHPGAAFLVESGGARVTR